MRSLDRLPPGAIQGKVQEYIVMVRYNLHPFNFRRTSNIYIQEEKIDETVKIQSLML